MLESGLKKKYLLFFFILLLGFWYPSAAALIPGHAVREPGADFTAEIYLPLVFETSALRPPFTVHAPYFAGPVRSSQAAVFWFGEVDPTSNYADVRVGYTSSELFIKVTVFDRRLWYDESPSPADLTDYDAVSLFLDLDGTNGKLPGPNTYRFDGQLNWWENDRSRWQAAYQGNGLGWALSPIPFQTESTWRGSSPNSQQDDKGWNLTYRIPFDSLGLASPPSQEKSWGLALILHDRDDAIGTSIPARHWPGSMDQNRSSTWGQLSFGLPIFTAPPVCPGGEIVIRHGLSGADVADAHVGGNTICGSPYGPGYFEGWGRANYAGYDQVNIQNQADVSDWPCFSKFYITFPLDQIPSGKQILSATLKLHLFGGSGGPGWDPPAVPSLIQALTVNEDWSESSITWNNAPQAVENIATAWVSPVNSSPPWPGVPYEWDISLAAAQAYSSDQPLRLVLYSADDAYHSGKYFLSSNAADWNAVARPTLTITWGAP
jgi:hypothetical protein